MTPANTDMIPRYTHDHFAYYNQVCEWYLDINSFKHQLLAFHVDRTRHFDHWLTERKKALGEKAARELMEEY